MAELEHMPNEQKKFVHPNLSEQSLYANGFQGGNSAFDMYLIGMLNGTPSFTLNMSYTTAKALQETINHLISQFEKKTNLEIPRAQDIAKKLDDASKTK